MTEQQLRQIIARSEDKAVNRAVNQAVNEAISNAVRQRLVQEIMHILSEGSITLSEIKAKFGIQRSAAQTDVKRLRAAGLIEFSGPPRTGKYVLTHKGKEKLLK